MSNEKSIKFLLVAGYPDSLLNFRGQLIDRLVAAGLTVHVAAPDLREGKIRSLLEAKGAVVHNLPLQRVGLNPAKDSISLMRLWRMMRSIDPDYFLGYTIKPVIYGSLAAFAARISHRYALITGLGYAFTGTEKKGVRRFIRSLVQHLYAVALKRAHKVFFQNPDDQALFRALKILKPGVVSRVVNGSGVDVGSFAVVPFPSAPIRFLLIARLLGDKGVREYVEAARQIRVFNSSVRFHLVGWIDENPDSVTQQELDNWIDEGVVEFDGKLSDVRPALAKCSVYVLPSYREGTPRTVLEAMAMGRPVITTDAPGCRETVIDGDNGFLVPVKSVDGLVEAMEKFISQPDLIEQMGKRSRVIAEEKYDVHKVNAFMLKEMGIQ
ncbi:MAG: glycosyltransferase family 4 protein [Desulfuromonadales bacterium]|nr:glycosyltransferase family 4 protein [Desulfuromonadales bacterium]